MHLTDVFDVFNLKQEVLNVTSEPQQISDSLATTYHLDNTSDVLATTYQLKNTSDVLATTYQLNNTSEVSPNKIAPKYSIEVKKEFTSTQV